MTTPTPTPFQQVVAIGETLLKVFIGAALGVVIAWGPSILDKSMGDWKAVAAAGIAAVAVFAYNYLSPAFTKYGVGVNK
jgi:hypothetical protein